ncbi:hypothetical protein Sango_2208100 [Sesamum angolense]|uniref:PGG domain-containing protein n=1 Tax=Sesamum angolense TaxID=2727404 RepID=A0AAE1W8V0_9LAMI|nr:hypothetical protein Sango_2208100 [Sesamum angolense]
MPNIRGGRLLFILASAKGYVDVVMVLLSVDPRMCLARDKNGMTPLHLSAIKSQLQVMTILLQAKPEAAQVTVYRGENILHLCIKHYQVEALKLLLDTISDPEFINSKDTDGNTILHLAVADKQVEPKGCERFGDWGIPKHAGCFGTKEKSTASYVNRNMASRALSSSPDHLTSSTNIERKSSDDLVKQPDDWLEKKRSALMVVASLIATMAFQVGVNPPSGVWQDDNTIDSQGNPVSDPHKAGFSVLAHNQPQVYTGFYTVNKFYRLPQHHIASDEWIAHKASVFYVDSDGDHMACD